MRQREPQTADELFAPPCAECVQETRGLVLGAVFGGIVIGAVAGWIIFRAR